MTPTADSANVSTRIDVSKAEQLLDGGESIHLAIKPSGWFVFQASWPALAVAALIFLAGFVTGKATSAAVPTRMLYTLATALVLLRLAFACIQWTSRMYILTSKRVMVLGGMMTVQIDQQPLANIAETDVSAGTAERVVNVGSLIFIDNAGQPLSLAWTCIAQPREVQQTVQQAIRRSKR